MTSDWWLGIRDCKMTLVIFLTSSFRAQARNLCHSRSGGDVWEPQMGNLLSMKPSGIATIYTLRRVHIFMRRTTPVEPVEPAEPLSNAIEGQHAPRTTPEPIKYY